MANKKPTAKSTRGPLPEFTNMRILPSGFQVTVTRAKQEFSRHFAGHSEKSLRAAGRYRDQILRELPDKRVNKIPPAILSALGLTRPVVGVFRQPRLRQYQVSYRSKGRWTCRGFTWNDRASEADCYAAAVLFRDEILRSLKR